MYSYNKNKRKRGLRMLVFILAGLILTGVLLSQIPAVKSRLSWRLQAAEAYARGVIDPVESLPTAAAHTVDPTLLPPPAISTATPTPEPTRQVSPTPTPSPTPLPEKVVLPAPAFEEQDINNCGPATLAMYLRTFGWEGDQFTISDLIKPLDADRNVNVEELIYYTRNYTGWLRTEFRVGGDLTTLRKFLAAGFPVMIEEGFLMEESYWPNDDRWAGHYLLVNGYDDSTQTFVTQDSFLGPDRIVSYHDLDRTWQTFNRVFIFAFYPDQEPVIREILGEDWEEAANRQNALEESQSETQKDPKNPYAWFNLGSNLVYFERYEEATQAYDQARALNLPQRMLRYQFGPFFAYFHTLRNDDLLTLSEYALKITPNSEEALLWHGWALYRAGSKLEAIEEFTKALEAHPGYFDAQYALDYVRQN